MNEKERNKLALLGFVIGLIIGSGIGYLSLLLFNWLGPFLNFMEPVKITIRSVLPFGIFMGLSMSATLKSGIFMD